MTPSGCSLHTMTLSTLLKYAFVGVVNLEQLSNAVCNAPHVHTPHSQVLELLRAGTRLKEIEQFLTTVLHERMQKRKRTQMLRGLLPAKHLQVREGGRERGREGRRMEEGGLKKGKNK